MNDTMKDLATEALRRAIDVATQTGEFLHEQAPLVVQELVRWQIVSNAVLAVMLVVATIVWWRPGLSFVKRIDTDGLILPIWVIGGAFGTSAGAWFLVSSILNVIKWTTAPRVALIEYAASLVK